MSVRYVLCAIAALGGTALTIAVGGRATTPTVERLQEVAPARRQAPQPAEARVVHASPVPAKARAASPSPVPAPAARGACTTRVALRDPIKTAERFLETAVARTNLGQAYALASRDLRGRTTCRDWLEGRLPVIAYRGIDWTRSNYRVVGAGEGQLVLRVVLFGKKSLPKAFLMELRRDGGAEEWLVGTWMSVPLQSLERYPPAAQATGPAS